MKHTELRPTNQYIRSIHIKRMIEHETYFNSGSNEKEMKSKNYMIFHGEVMHSRRVFVRYNNL